MARTLDLFKIITPKPMATAISRTYIEWEMRRQIWLAQKQEIRDYIFAIDTSQTSAGSLPWKNSTHIPKLCQIRDNLHANYMAALFPNDRPLVWEGDDQDSESKEKRQIIESYMENKLRMGKFRLEMSKCILDYIDYGNAFAMPTFVAEQTTDPLTGEKTPGYVGPKVVRVSPLDIVFDITSASFEESPKIIRSLKTLGTIKADIEDHPEMGYLAEVFEEAMVTRRQFVGLTMSDFAKTEAFQIDGFSNYLQYFQGDYVELMDFYGDFYDTDTGTLYKNYMITVMDRCHILRKVPNPSWLGNNGIRHVGWRQRPDNLMAMGPLDNLIGMQYRIDHLENAKADAFDLIVHPVIKIKGFVEDFEYGPGQRVFTGDDGDVEFMRPDTTMLSCDTQISLYEAKMEEMAGAPKQAMGFRTPGEKTAYEVQILENGANRVFINKTSYFEEIFMEPLINAMLEGARRNMGASDLIRVLDNQYGVVNFMKITKDDITAAGKIRPIGARHFARNANIVQNLTQLGNSALGRDPTVQAHISGKKIAYLMEELLDLERYELVADNIRVAEELETQKLVARGQQQIASQNAPQSAPPGTPPGIGAQAAANSKSLGIATPDSNQLATISPRAKIGAVPAGATPTSVNSVGPGPQK